jgi:hypothetical protein
MALVAVKPALQPPRKLYTVTHRSGGLFGVHFSKTAVVAFHSKDEAHLVARALEHHKATHGRWPSCDFENTKKELTELKRPSLNRHTLEELLVINWSCLQDVTTLCKRAFLDLTLCSRVDVKAGNLVFHTKLLRIAPEDFLDALEYAFEVPKGVDFL